MKLLVFFLAGLAFAAQGYGHEYPCRYQENRQCFRKSTCVLYKNGGIYTVAGDDWKEDPQEAMVIQNGVIDFIGKNLDAEYHVSEKYTTGECRVIDLGDRIILPGIHDVHMHPMEVGSPVAGTCMMDKDSIPYPENKAFWKPFEQDECFKNQVGTDWTLGHGHSIWALLNYTKSEGSKDPKELLDFYVPNEPVVIMEETSHSVWVNSEALRRAGLDGKFPKDPIGGKVMLNHETNEANGILLENAGIWMMDKAFNQSLYKDLPFLAVEGLQNGLKKLAKYGITSFVDARCYWQRGNHEAYKKVEDANNMTARAVLAMWAYPDGNDDDQIPQLIQLYDNPPNGLVRRTAIKVYQDGIIPTRSAKLLKPYDDDFPDLGFGNRGMNYFTPERLTQYIKELQDFGPNGEGYDFLVHVVGDAASREVLDAVAANPIDDSRHRCTHIELVDKDDWPRFKQLHVIADGQVAGDFALNTSLAFSDMIGKVGKKRGQNSIPIASLEEYEAKVTLSSDWDVSEVNPFLGLSHAINRGPQSVSLKSAVEMYTINAAYAMRQEKITGSLEVEKAADLIVVDRNIFDDEGSLIKARVLQTVVDGEEVYSLL